MTTLDDEVYNKLLKDANDNKQLVKIARAVVALIIFIVLFIFWGKPMIDLSTQQKRVEVECEIAIVQAENAVRVREIESVGMKTEDYLRWLEIREGNR